MANYIEDRYGTALPPENSGLHCGDQWTVMAQAVGEALPPENSGLHCGVTPSVNTSTPVLALPPENSGLHCGMGMTVARGRTTAVRSRLKTAGSIAAGISGRP